MPLSQPPIAFRTDLSVATVEIGGTGANTAAGARGNLSVPAIADLAETNANLTSKANSRAAARSLRFNGTAGVTINVACGTNPFCTVSWVRFDDAGDYPILGTSSNNYLYRQANGVVNSYNGANHQSAGYTIPNGKEVCVIQSRAADGTLKLYFDNVEVHSSVDATAWDFNRIGATTAFSQFAKGTIRSALFNVVPTAAQRAYISDTGTIPTELLPNLAGNPAGVVLNNLAFANAAVGSGFEYETFTGASALGFTAANSAANGFAYMNGGPSYTARLGDSFGISYDLTLNSGQAPSFVIGANQVALTPGIGKFTILPITTAVTSYFGISNSAATDFALANVKIFALGCEFAMSPDWDARGSVIPNIAGTGNHGILPSSGVYPTNAPSVPGSIIPDGSSLMVEKNASGACAVLGKVTLTAGTAFTTNQVLLEIPFKGLFYSRLKLVAPNRGLRVIDAGAWPDATSALEGVITSEVRDVGLVPSAYGHNLTVELVWSANFSGKIRVKVKAEYTQAVTTDVYIVADDYTVGASAIK